MGGCGGGVVGQRLFAVGVSGGARASGGDRPPPWWRCVRHHDRLVHPGGTTCEVRSALEHHRGARRTQRPSVGAYLYA